MAKVLKFPAPEMLYLLEVVFSLRSQMKEKTSLFKGDVGQNGSNSNVGLCVGSTKFLTITNNIENNTGAKISITVCRGFLYCSIQFFHISNVNLSHLLDMP